MATINGTSGNDTLNGTAVDDSILGQGGNDTIIALDGNDTVYGGDGNDRLEGRGGDDTLRGDAGRDLLIGGAGSDTLTGGSEVDTFRFALGSGSDTVTDFVVGQDKIDIQAYGFDTFDAVLAASSQSGPDVLIQLAPGETLTLQNVELSLLASRDFVGLPTGIPTLAGSIIPTIPNEPTTAPIAAMITVTTDDYAPYTVAAGTTVHATSLFSIFGSDGFGYMSPLTNNGTIWSDIANDRDSNGDLLSTVATIGQPNSVRGVVNNGLMVLHLGPSTVVNAIAFEETTADNHGQVFIINEGTGNAWFVTTFLTGPTVNSGLVAVQARHGIAVGYEFDNAGSFDNQAGAQLLVEGTSAIAFFSARGNSYTPTAISNEGAITAHSLDPEQLSYALFLGGVANEQYDVTNSGTITADVAIFGGDDSGTVSGNVIQNVHNLAGGQINGLIFLQRGDDRLDNAGTINGDVYMGDGIDTVDNHAGTINGVTDLGWGNDSYTGGKFADFVAGGRGDDHIDGGSGNDLLIGGVGNDLLSGGAGNDGLFGEWGDDVIVTKAGDLVDGGEGNDRIELGDYTFAFSSGGEGFDTLVLPGGTRTLNLHSALAEGAFADFEQVELGGGKTLVIQPNDVTALTGGETSLRLVTTATDHVNLVGSWVHGTDHVVDSVTWHTYTSGGVTILVSGDAAVATGAANTAGDLDPVASGAAAPLPGTGPLDFTNPYELVSGFELTHSDTIEAPVTLVSLDGSPVFTVYGTGISLTNYGTIESFRDASTSAGSAAFALQVPNIERVTNYGTIIVDNESTTGGAFALNAGYFSIVENYGFVGAISAQSTAEGVQGSQVFNFGTIEAHALAGGSFGVQMIGRIFENHGTIIAHSDAPDFISAYGLPTAVGAWLREGDHINTGDISASAVTGGSVAVAYDIGSASSLTNSGTLTGEMSLLVREDNNLAAFHLINSGTMTGDVKLGIAADVVDNSGHIDGAIDLGAGSDRFDGHLGIQTGPISGGGGQDTIIGGQGSEIMNGGNGNDTLVGNGGNDTLEGGVGNDSIDGGTGIDMASYAAAAAGVTVSLATTLQQDTGQGLDTLSNIENLRGSAFADHFTGNDQANQLDGGAGADAMAGGGGNDTYVVDNVGDVVTEAAAGGTDLVQSSVTFTLGGNVENLTLLGALAVSGTGNSLANTITGNDAANTLNGGGGADRLTGGLGDDIYYVDNAADTTVESAGAGVDEVRSSLDWVLGASLETLSLTGSANINGTGNSAANRINGNAGANHLSGLGGSDTIYGLGGNDTLDAAAGNDSLNGGLGADSMTGGTGNDIYYVDDAGDSTLENAGEGIDTVRSTVSHVLAANVDRLELNGSASINGTGNGDSNRITGNSGANGLSGLGGNDYLYGVGGNDTLAGGDGNDLLNGGTGSDSMNGGAGRDLYYVDSAGDTVTELAAEGFDTIRTTVSYTLSANTERLDLIGSASIDGTGNSASNRLSGNAGVNVLSGLAGNDIIYGFGGNDTLDGGAGRDFLVGGTGADKFVFDDGDFWGLTTASCDRIDDFNHAESDKIDLSAVDANAVTSGDQGFAFIGSGAFSGTAGELRYEQSGANTLVYGDTNGDGNADFLVLLLGSHALTSSDFILA